ncbi:MAG: 6-bladed beta-propeller [Balneola sp.]
MVFNQFKSVVWIVILISSLSCQQVGDDNITSKKVEIELPKEVKDLENVTIISPQKAPTFDVSFRKTATFGETEDVLFQYVGQFSVDISDRVYIADRNDVKVYAADGTFIKTLGRRGRGPGEFNNFGGLTPRIFDKRLYVYDEVLNRINVFDLGSLSFLHSISLNPQNWNHIEELTHMKFGKIFQLKDQTLFVGFTSFRFSDKETFYKYYKVNTEGEVISEKIFEHKNTRFFEGVGAPMPMPPPRIGGMSVPSSRNYIIDIDSKDNIYLVCTDSFLVKVYNSQGKYIRSLYYPFAQLSLNKDEIIESFKGNKLFYERAKAIDYPKTWPAINQFFLDDEDRVWISTITEDLEYYTWYVLSNSGELLTTFKWKGKRFKRHVEQKEVRIVRNGYLYTKEKDEEGADFVVRYSIDLEMVSTDRN